jgi:hypothetical protein
MQDTHVDIRQLDVRGLEGIKGYVYFDGTRLVVRTPINENNNVVAPTSCKTIKPGQFVYGMFSLFFNDIPSDEISKFYMEQLNEGKPLYDVLKHIMSRPDYRDYRFNNRVKATAWIDLLFCLFEGIELEVADDQKASWLRRLDNQSRDCIFKEALKSSSGRTRLNLGSDDTLIDALWTSNGLAVPTCDCNDPEQPGGGNTFTPLKFNDPGSYDYTVERGVTFITAVIVAGGATGGCSGDADSQYNRQGMGGGQAGEVVVWRDLPVTEGMKLNIRVGAGGQTRARKYEYAGKPANGESSSVSVGGTTKSARGGMTTTTYIGGGNSETSNFNPLAGNGGKGGSNSMAPGGQGGQCGFAGDDWNTASGKAGEFPGGGGGGAGSDDDTEGFPGGDGAHGCVWLFKNNEGYSVVSESLTPITAGQNARRYK